LLAQAIGPNTVDTNYALSDYGLPSRLDLKHVCGRYALRDDGRLTTWDLFVGPSDPDRLRKDVELALLRERMRADGNPSAAPRAPVSVVVESSDRFEWPPHCRRIAAAKAPSVLVATRVL
jgi:hypothetical protein